MRDALFVQIELFEEALQEQAAAAVGESVVQSAWLGDQFEVALEEFGADGELFGAAGERFLGALALLLELAEPSADFLPGQGVIGR